MSDHQSNPGHFQLYSKIWLYISLYSYTFVDDDTGSLRKIKLTITKTLVSYSELLYLLCTEETINKNKKWKLYIITPKGRADRRLGHQSFDWKTVLYPCITTQDFRFCWSKPDKYNYWIVQRTKVRLLRNSDDQTSFPPAVTNFCNTRPRNHLPGGGREEHTVTVWVFMVAILNSEDVTKVLNKNLHDQKPRKDLFAGFSQSCMSTTWAHEPSFYRYWRWAEYILVQR